MDKGEVIPAQLSFQKIELEVDSEITHIESPLGMEEVYVSTSTDLYAFNPDGSPPHKIVGAPDGVDQFAVITSQNQVLYLSEGEFRVCDREGTPIKSISVESETILYAVSFLLSPLHDKVAFVAESVEAGMRKRDLSSYRLCLLDLETETSNLLSDKVYSTLPKLISWVGKSSIVVNEEPGEFLRISTTDRSQQVMNLGFSSVYRGGTVESVAVSHDGESIAFSITYPMERVQLFIREDGQSRLIGELEGEGGLPDVLQWSPNKEWLSYINTCFPAPTLYLIKTTSEMSQVIEVVTLGPDSKLVWLSTGDGFIYGDENRIHILRSPDILLNC